MKATSVTTVRRTFTLGILILGGLAVAGAWNVHLLVESVDRLVPNWESASSHFGQAANEMPPDKRNQRQAELQALRNQTWWIVVVFLAGAPVIIGLLLTSNWLMRHDSAQRQLTDKRLREREARLQTILDSEPECVKFVAEDGTLLEMNAAGLQMIEAGSGSKVIGHPVESLLAPEYRRNFQLLNEKVFRGESGTLEYELVGLKGGRRWMETHAAPLRDEYGQVIAQLGITRDITGRKQSEAALRESEARYRLLADNADDFVALVDIQGNRLYVSPSYFRVTGWTLEELQLTDWRTRLHPDDLPMIERTRAANLAGETTLIEHRIRCKDGSWIWVELRCKPLFGPEGGVIQFLQWSRDITARKRIELELRASQVSLEVAQSITRIGSWEFDPVRRSGSWSKEMFRLFDRDPKLGTPTFEEFLESVHPDDRHILLDANSQVAQVKRTVEVSYRVAPAFSGLRYFSGKIHATRDALGRVVLLNGTLWDVTEQKKATAALCESEHRLRLTLENAQHGLWDWEITTGRIHLDDLWYAIIGDDHRELAPTVEMWEQSIYSEDMPRVMETLQRHLDSGDALFDVDYRTRTNSGETVWLNSRGRVHQRDADGRPLRMMGTFHDITARKKAERALHDSEIQYRLLAMNTDDFVQLLDLQGTRLYVSPAYFRVTGWTMEDLLTSDWRKRLHADDVPKLEHARSASLAGATALVEHRIHCKDGSWIWVELRCKPIFDEHAQVIQILQVSRDITARKKIQAALQESSRMLEQSQSFGHIGSWSADPAPDGLIQWSAETCRIFGLTLERFEGRAEVFFELVHSEDRERVRSAGLAALRSGEPYEVEYRIQRPDGQTRWIHQQAGVDCDDAVRPLRWIGVVQDVTASHLAGAELQTSRERLATLSRKLIAAQESERRQVARELHDEIGQVLTAVGLNLHHLKSVFGPDAKTELDASLNLVGRAMEQVRDLSLNLRPPMLDVLGLSAAVRECVEQHRKQTGVDVKLELNLESRLLPELEITCYRVVQSAWTNISRHAQASQVSVEIRQNDLGLELIVCDNGIGLDVDRVRQRTEQGESFGILAMQERVQLVGGTFRIDSAEAPGVGTSIRAHLPLVMPAVSEVRFP